MLGSFVQGTLEAVDRHDAELGRRVREALAPETLEAIERSSRIALVPIALDVEVTERLYEIAGAERARSILRENLAAAFHTPILQSFVRMALRLRGRDPAGLFAFASKVWGQLYRDAGTLRYEALGPCEGRLEASALPPELSGHRDYFDGVAATVSALFDLVELDGHAELKAVDAGAGRAIISVVWDAGD